MKANLFGTLLFVSTLTAGTVAAQPAPFNQIGGLGRVHELFGERLAVILEELNKRLAA